MTSEPIRPDTADISERVDEANQALIRALERYADSLTDMRIEVEQLDARANAAEQERDELRARFADVRELHTDSPAGVCPSCCRLGDVSDTDDGLVDWPCPTLRAIGVGPS